MSGNNIKVGREFPHCAFADYRSYVGQFLPRRLGVELTLDSVQ